MAQPNISQPSVPQPRILHHSVVQHRVVIPHVLAGSVVASALSSNTQSPLKLAQLLSKTSIITNQTNDLNIQRGPGRRKKIQSIVFTTCNFSVLIFFTFFDIAI